MKRLISLLLAIPLSLVLSAPAVAEPNQPHIGPTDNWGQCTQILLSWGVSPSEIAPGQFGVGPAVIIYEQDGVTIFKLEKSNGFDFGFACHFEPPLPE